MGIVIGKQKNELLHLNFLFIYTMKSFITQSINDDYIYVWVCARSIVCEEVPSIVSEDVTGIYRVWGCA